MSEAIATCEPLASDVDGMSEARTMFVESERREPRDNAELIAWIDGAQAFAAYLASNPIVAETSLADEKLRQIAAKEREEGERAAAIAKSSQLCKDAAKAVALASRSEARCLLRAGSLARLSIQEALNGGERSRGSTLTILKGKFAEANREEWSDRRVNEMIQASAARELLDPSETKRVAYSAWAKGFATLVVRSKDPRKETYSFIEGIENDARAMFMRVTDGVGLSVDTVWDECRELVARSKELAAKEAARRKEESDKAEMEQRAAALKASEALKAKEQEREQAAHALTARTWTDNEDDKAERARLEEEARRKEQEAAQAKREADEREFAARKARAKQREEAQAKKEADERLAAQRKKDEKREQRATAGPVSYQRTADTSDPVAHAAMLADYLFQTNDVSACWRTLLAKVKDHNECPDDVRKSCAAALAKLAS